jgi:hypothetical protein
VNDSRIHQPAWAVWIFHQVAPSLVLNTVGIVCRVHRAFEAFDDSDQNLAQFVELRVFPKCDQFLVSWPRVGLAVEPARLNSASADYSLLL